MSRKRGLFQRRMKEISELSQLQDDDALEYIQNIRRNNSYPEELLRGPIKTLLKETANLKITKENFDEDEHYAKMYAHRNRMKSCGQLQSALVTLAIREGDVIQLWRLLDRKDANVRFVDGLGMQPIHYACIYGKLDIIKVLLQYDVDINQTTVKGEYPLELAVREGNFDVAQYLINKGARVKTIVDGIKDDSFRPRSVTLPRNMDSPMDR